MSGTAIPGAIFGGDGITVSPEGRISASGAAGTGTLARGIVEVDNGEGTAVWVGPHPGFEDEVTYVDEGEYLLTLSRAVPVDDAEASIARFIGDETRVTTVVTFSYARPSTTTIRVFADTSEAAGDGSFSIVVVGNPEE